jgi:hypothetical protein
MTAMFTTEGFEVIIAVVLILGWCILLRLCYNENDSTTYVSMLIVSLLYTDHTTCFGYIDIFRCVIYIKMLKIVIITLTDPLI